MFNKKAWRTSREFDSNNCWSLTIFSNRWFELRGYNSNVGYKGSGCSLIDAWQDIIKSCDEKIIDCVRVKNEAMNEIKLLKQKEIKNED